MTTAPIRRWIVCICGFLQDRRSPTGMERVWLALRCAYERGANGTCVTLHNWNDPWRVVARQMLRLGGGDPVALDVAIVGYSWGVGYGALRLCRELRAIGVSVRVLISIDGVYHSPWALWRARWSPVLGEPRLQVPDNVRHVQVFRQQQNWPRGHEVFAQNPAATRVIDSGPLALRHEQMDDSLAVLAAAVTLCGPRAEETSNAA